VFQAVSPSVVSVYVRGERGGREIAATGSGFVWDRAGHIVTNNHVISGASEIGVLIGNEHPIPATLVGAAPWADLAVIRLNAPPNQLHPITVGSSHDLQVGQSVFAIGNPYGLARSLTTGIISALERKLPTNEGREVAGVIQTDAAINPGNSGGPLVDSAGRLIGVNTAIVAPSGSFSGIGFAIPVDTVNRIVPALIKTGHAPMPGIGIMVYPQDLSAAYGIRGIVIQSVVPGSAAGKAGLKGIDGGGRVGDVIVGVEGRPVETLGDLFAVLQQIGIGNEATLQIVRNGRRENVKVKVQDIST
jgi:2-alkenal reductase